MKPSPAPEIARASSPLRLAVGLAMLAAAIVFLVAALRPSPLLSLSRHWQVFGAYASISAALTAWAAYLVGRRFQPAVLVSFVALTAIAALAHPVCVLIPESERPAFESVRSLPARAAQGESFCHLEGQWYVCKSFVSRAFFF